MRRDVTLKGGPLDGQVREIETDQVSFGEMRFAIHTEAPQLVENWSGINAFDLPPILFEVYKFNPYRSLHEMWYVEN